MLSFIAIYLLFAALYVAADYVVDYDRHPVASALWDGFHHLLGFTVIITSVAIGSAYLAGILTTATTITVTVAK